MKLRNLISESMFLHKVPMTFGYLNDFIKNYERMGKKNVVKQDRSGNLYGFKKGSKEAEWKWIKADMEIHTDMSTKEVMKIQRGKL